MKLQLNFLIERLRLILHLHIVILWQDMNMSRMKISLKRIIVLKRPWLMMNDKLMLGGG